MSSIHVGRKRLIGSGRLRSQEVLEILQSFTCGLQSLEILTKRETTIGFSDAGVLRAVKLWKMYHNVSHSHGEDADLADGDGWNANLHSYKPTSPIKESIYLTRRQREIWILEVSPSAVNTLWEWIIVWELDPRDILEVISGSVRRQPCESVPIRQNSCLPEACTSFPFYQRHL